MKRGISIKFIHAKCRNNIYPLSNIQRSEVPDDKVIWDTNFPEYNPINYTSKALEGKPWADPSIENESSMFKWNKLDGNVNRISFITNYCIDEHNYPINPYGRTGIKGRGLLGRWGPNHAADPVVTRWKRNQDNSITVNEITNKPILQFVGIQRRDSGEWAIPGGMVDPGEKVTVTLRREFMEEAMNTLEKSVEELKIVEKTIETFFSNGEEIYKGYVDDPRNTDNAWMETIVFNFHDASGKIVGNFNLQAGDDATKVKWIDIDCNLILYASHKDFIQKIVQKHASHW
ncbi:putative nudix hydrolase 6 [Trichogramma pretiosum]|uniref:putative nudix hydrolase 6 n=1 Tax=Trichogramma pretiosum TaxID=7493 RepID=UPI0006C9E130|nr:putative nudix hydrolase 6 [Trichogramma pretiosum]XP_014237378.1 putative nudix hydrolase 6 [Trichogramma pretiosum]XP_014237386.1 putative nudix hydrolase 6 [Trichogramma pretiosum]XP_014237394.1 putative nudix hydrolase 6 [Trichogramma pretiosum]XP_014237403.1 putative nudix hydrolase 6 [Trichogramma pretiosum]XP_023315328.1 putative nudix hydrolase 6 [Trichogramma pretiosum]